LIVNPVSFTSSVELPQTGQTICYDSAGAVVGCAGTGQDGEIQAGVAWPNPRFKDNGDQTITDKLTGLMWTKDAGTPTVSGTPTCIGGPMNWQAALDYVACLNTNNYLGHNDWRLPNVNELESLVNGQSSQATWLTGQGFINVPGGSYWSSYWSSTSYAVNPVDAWGVGMYDIYMYAGIVVGFHKTDLISVWPIRGGQGTLIIWRTGQTTCYDINGNVITCTGTGQDGELQQGVSWPSPRFTDNGDQTVTDSLTNLMWTKDASAPTVGTCAGGSKTWQGALNYVACLNTNSYLGHNDWRLPNRKEIYSLKDFSRYNPSIPAGNPFTNVQSSSFWSSTSYASSPSFAWYVLMWDGFVNGANKISNNYAWPVRGGNVIPIYTVRIAGPPPIYFTSIQTAYNAAANGNDLQIQAMEFTEDLNLAGNVTLSLDGGYDSTYSAVSGMTIVKGTMTIGGSGSAAINNMIIK